MSSQGIVFRPEQARFLDIPQASVCYWLRPNLLRSLASGTRVGHTVNVEEGYKTADNARFLRACWEVPPEGSWVRYEKGSGYARWAGRSFYVVDWRHDGAALRNQPGAAVPRPPRRNPAGLCYSEIARGSLGFRFVPSGAAFDFKAHAVFGDDARLAMLCVLLNARVLSYLARSMSPSLYLNQGYVASLPLPRHESRSLGPAGQVCHQLKRHLVSLDPTERAFVRALLECEPGDGVPLHPSLWPEATAAVLHAVEGWAECLVFDAYGLDANDTAAVLAETGTPAGWFPPIAGFDAVPELQDGLPALPCGFAEHYADLERRRLEPGGLAALQDRLRAHLDAGPGGNVEEDNGGSEGADARGAFNPIPTETFVEELAVKLEVHPVSVFRLLEALRRDEGLVCPAELKRHVEDLLSVTVLRMLGHRWPEQGRHERERGRPMIAPQLVDEDGIIPLQACAGEQGLLDRLRAWLDERFGPEGGPDAETRAGQVLGKPLERWLERDFFRHHIKQFRKRPIAWHLRSERGTFSTFVYYGKFDHDRLHGLRARYVRDTLDGLRRALGEARQQEDASRAGLARLAKLEEQVAELESFDDRLRRLLEGHERECRIWVPWKAAEEQPAGWRPDVHDGVRVNVAPVQRSGLLAAPVLAAKDLAQLVAPERR